MRALRYLLVAGLAALGACSAYDTDLGPTPFLCGETDPKCPDGYNCLDDITTGEQVCVVEGGDIDSDFDCIDDSALEPNNAIDTATATPVDGMKTYEKGDLSICPAGDKDLFAISIGTQNENIELTVDFGSNGAQLVAAILNAGGIPIRTAAPVMGEPFRIQAIARNMPVGQYYAQIAASVSGAISLNNYSFTINVTGP